MIFSNGWGIETGTFHHPASISGARGRSDFFTKTPQWCRESSGKSKHENWANNESSDIMRFEQQRDLGGREREREKKQDEAHEPECSHV